ncbi:MAG: CoA-binding protein [Nanoarchaeota archaeon]|nr:CoA-binding protein [Nanoarchaeota archaeon]
MSILIDSNSRILIQGITGNQAGKTTKEMMDYGSKVVCGVTPGKGGQRIFEIPVYNSVNEALKNHKIDASLILVPPFKVLEAAFEAIDAKIKLIVIITENVPVHDSAKIISYAKSNNSRIIGPSSVGIISPGKSKIGPIGGFKRAFIPGHIGLISKSGGMASETAFLLSQNNLGQSTVVGIGGDRILGTSFSDLLELFEKDTETKAVVIFGEVGGTYEQEISSMIQQGLFTKPVIAFISGSFVATLPEIALGHAGAIIESEDNTREAKVKSLKQAGVLVAEVHHEILNLVKEVLKI